MTFTWEVRPADVVALLALGVSAVAFVRATRISALSSQAQVLLLIEQSLANATDNYLKQAEELAVLLHKAAGDSTDENDIREGFASRRFGVAKEKYCNAVEAACALYLDGRVDGKRFKKSYADAFRAHVKSDDFKEFYDATQSKYWATLKCIQAWDPGRE